MSNITYVPLPNDLLVRLIQRYETNYAGYIEHAVESFLDRTEDDWKDSSSTNNQGYAWDQLLLPEGTKLQTKYKGEWQVATVEKGKIKYNETIYDSPSKACNAMRGDIPNNAWMSLQIKRPQDVEFRLADRFRRN